MMPQVTEALDKAREAAFLVQVLESQRNHAANHAAHFQTKANMLEEDNRSLREGIEEMKKQHAQTLSKLEASEKAHAQTSSMLRDAVDLQLKTKTEVDELQTKLAELLAPKVNKKKITIKSSKSKNPN